jgi:hypothetical protein
LFLFQCLYSSSCENGLGSYRVDWYSSFVVERADGLQNDFWVKLAIS